MRYSLIQILIFLFVTQNALSQNFQLLDGFKYVVVTPMIFEDGSRDKIGVESKAISILKNKGLLYLDAEKEKSWPEEAKFEPCLIAYITIKAVRLPNAWDCGYMMVNVKNCKNETIINDKVKSRTAFCNSPPYECCYPQWIKAITRYFNEINYHYNSELVKHRTNYPELERSFENEESLTKYFSLNNLDDIEGIYESYLNLNQINFKIGIKKNGNHSYSAIILESDYEQFWKPGEIIGHLEPSAMTNYFSTNWHTARKENIEAFSILENNAILSIEFKDPSSDEIVKQKYIKMYPSKEQNLISDNFDTESETLEPKSIEEKYKQNTNVITVEKSDVDLNIPLTDLQNTNTYALIIGNEDYTKFQTDLNAESNVDFARKDAEIFAEYCEKTLGIPKENITLLKDAISTQMQQAIEIISKIAMYHGGEANIIFYYAGHGFPDEATKEAYLMPVDVSGANVKYGIKLNYLYEQLTKYPSQKVLVILDACFSGGGRNQGLLSSRGVKIKPKENIINGNLVVFSSSSGEQSALPYQNKQHGMFTYFLLKKLKDSGGDISLEELSDYVTKQVQINALKINRKEQNPNILVSPNVGNLWMDWKLN